MINCGFKCSQTPFINCTADNGGGGAIYIKNTIDVKNEINFELIDFIENGAIYGGAIYLYIESRTNPITVKNCQFLRNEAFIMENYNSELYGGSALFLTSKSNSLVSACTFSQNKGKGSAFKIYNKFDPSSSLMLQNDNVNENSLTISKCSFEIEEESACSIYYIGNKNKCSFSGVLGKGCHYIDGVLTTKYAPKLLVRSCHFAETNNIAIDLNNPIFSFENNLFKVFKNTKWKTIVAATGPICAVIVILSVVAIIIHYKRQKAYSKVLHEWEMNEESNNLSQKFKDSTDETLIQSLL